MNYISRLLLFTCLFVAIASDAAGPPEAQSERSRVFILTDISNEPDDEQSMVRFLVYANEYDIEGISATTSTWLRNTTRVDLIHRQIAAYSKVRSNLEKHARGYPTSEALLQVTTTGQPGYGMQAVGVSRSSGGSRLLLAAADKPDNRPLWISIWGGANTLAQALSDARQQRNPEELNRLIKKLRVYSISDQDDAGPWLRREFTNLFYIVSPSGTDWKEYWRATWTGISGDRHYKNGPMHKFHLVDNPWLEENVIRNHGPLGELYPKLAYIMEGDTPSFLGLVNNGLGWQISPAYGGWAGRYVLYHAYGETRPIWTNNQDSRDTVTAENGQTVTSDPGTIWRWREHFQNDFAARMDWCISPEYAAANHNPIAILNNDNSRRTLELAAKSGEKITCSATGSLDPDGQKLSFTWFFYREAGSFIGDVKLSSETGEITTFEAPRVKAPETLHLILQVNDSGTPNLFAYRRAVIHVNP